MTRVTLCTANTPGAVAILQLHGDGVADVMCQLTGRQDWPDRRALLCGFAGIDEGLAVLLSAEAAQLMPHGGPRVVQKLIEHLTDKLGCEYEAEPDTQSTYPEAQSRIEADMLDAIARAASPAAIDLLAAQPSLWRDLFRQNVSDAERESIIKSSQTLGHLITPPTVVVVGPANVGKSTLTNALMGQAVSIVADLPGTTRDWVGGLVELNVGIDPQQAIAMHWLDTPGLRDSDDDIEQRAIALAIKQIERADVLIAMRDLDHPWPDAASLRRAPDLWVVNKADNAAGANEGDGDSKDHPLPLSAEQGNNLDALQRAVIQQLGLDRLSKGPWAFSTTLTNWLASGVGGPVEGYV